jgi:hypothetical protein
VQTAPDKANKPPCNYARGDVACEFDVASRVDVYSMESILLKQFEEDHNVVHNGPCPVRAIGQPR